MSTSDRGIARRSLRRIALAGVVSLSMIGLAGVASAQESDVTVAVPPPAAAQEESAGAGSEESSSSESSESSSSESSSSESSSSESSSSSSSSSSSATEEPEPITRWNVSLQADCAPDSYGNIYVHVFGSSGYTLTAAADGKSTTLAEGEGDSAGYYYGELFEIDAYGLVPVTISGGGGDDVTVNADLTACAPEAEYPTDTFSVSVTCVDGYGLVTITVYNDGEKTKKYTIKVDDIALSPYIKYPFQDGVVATIVESAEDGEYVISLHHKGEKIDEQAITVDCMVSTTLPPTTTTAPPQGAPVPGDDDLANTGAAVGGLVALGGLALVLGAALVLTGRRRAARVTND